MQTIIDRIRGKLDLNIRLQSDHTIELNDLLMAIEKAQKGVEAQLQDLIQQIDVKDAVIAKLKDRILELEEDDQSVTVEE